jgi:hypothetical protein
LELISSFILHPFFIMRGAANLETTPAQARARIDRRDSVRVGPQFLVS